jgi:dynein heavy chain
MIKDINDEGERILNRKRKDMESGYLFKVALDKFQSRFQKFKRNDNKFNELYTNIIKRYKIESIVGDKLEDYDTLKKYFPNLEQRMKDAYEEISRNKETWRIDADEKITENNDFIKLIEGETTSGIYLDSESNVKEVEEGLRSIQERMNECIDKNNQFIEWYEKLEFKDRPNKKLTQSLETTFNIRNKLWRNKIQLEKDSDDWKNRNLAELRDLKIDEKLNNYTKVQLDVQDSLDEFKLDTVLTSFQLKIEVERKNIDAINALSTSSLQERHWRKIFAIFKINYIDIKSIEEINLGDLIDKDISLHSDELVAIASTATQQEKINKDIEKIEKDWNTCKFDIRKHNNSKDKFIIATIEEVKNQLEEHSQLIQSALGSKYVSDIREKVQKWDDDLINITRVIEEWLMCQKQWIYLENIFSADDIKRQIPEAHKNFSKVNKGFRELMSKTNQNPNILDRCRQEGLYEMLCRFHKELDSIKKNLEDYLQTKRQAFPRFYFLSDDELLKIISQTRNPRAVQDYLSKCFDGIKTISFASDTSNEI